MTLGDIVNTAVDGVTYDTLKYVAAPLVFTLAGTVVVKYAFKKLSEWKEIIVFSSSVFVALFITFVLLGNRPQQPQLTGAIQSVITGAINDNKDSVMVISMNVMNIGSMQSIVKNWSISASVNGSSFQGSFPMMPKTFSFTNANSTAGNPSSITFHNEDSLLDKGINAIQQGSMLPGILFVVFTNVDASVFKFGADITVNYEDAFSKKYSASIKTSPQVGNIGMMPGLHSDLVCKLPEGGMMAKSN
jgi:hypothetical protein